MIVAGATSAAFAAKAATAKIPIVFATITSQHSPVLSCFEANRPPQPSATVLGLGSKLGPLLFQLPPSLAFDPQSAGSAPEIGKAL